MNELYTWANDLYPIVAERFSELTDTDKRKDIIKSTIGIDGPINAESKTYEPIGGYGYIPKYDGNAITSLNQKRGYITTIRPEEFAASVEVSYKKAKIDKSGEAKRAGTRLAESMLQTQLRDFENLFAYGWNSNFVGADGLPLFSASHKLNTDSDDTYSNAGTTAFSVKAITDTQTLCNKFVTSDGLPFGGEYDLIIVSLDLEAKAREYFGKEAKLIPDSNENGANPVYGMKYMVNKRLGAKQWMLADSRLMKEAFQMVYNTQTEIFMPKQTNPLITSYVVYADYAFGWNDPRAVFGHNPA